MKKHYLLSILMLAMMAALLPSRVSAQTTETQEDSCQYRLVMESTRAHGWEDGYLDFGRNSQGYVGALDSILHFSLTHSGSETVYFNLPKGWVTIDHRNIKRWYATLGTFSLYDANDRLVFAGPEDLPESFQWYNGCSLDIPVSASHWECNQQGSMINLSWVNPTLMVSGDTLPSLSSVEIRRNGELIHTFLSVTPGEQMNYTDEISQDGTYQYSVQCFNEAGGGVPVASYIHYGTELILYNFSHNAEYSDTTCHFTLTNDQVYTVGGHAVVTVCRESAASMWKFSGNLSLDNGVSVSVQAKEGDHLADVELGEDELLVPHRELVFTFDIPAGASPQFHFSMECVDTLYEYPDTSLSIMPDSNGIIYVTQEGAGLRNGSSWENATPWLSYALHCADTMTAKPVIWVAKGIYYGRPQFFDDGSYYRGDTYAFIGQNGVNVYGGFAGNEPADYNLSFRDFEQNETVLDGLQHHSVVLLKGSVWNGFHIRKGTQGCALRDNSYLQKCFVSECVQNGVFSEIRAIGTAATVDSCSISNNIGNGVYASGLRVVNSEICWNEGNGVKVPSIENCIITNNSGYGLYLVTRGEGKTNLVANNNGCGVEVEKDISLYNNTIVNNGGSGIRISTSGTSGPRSIQNCVIWGNLGNSIDNRFNADYGIANCAIEGTYKPSSFPCIPLAPRDETSGIQPMFVNPTAGAGIAYSGGDWHLLPNSVLINRGSANAGNLPETDLDGNTRIQQGIPDIGAYESDYGTVITNLFIHPDDNHIIYVKEDGDGDGSSWQNATSDLATAIELVWLYDSVTQIWVSEGIYPTPNYPYYVKENLHLMGGFAGNEPADYDVDLRNTMAHATILDGQQQNRVLHQTMDFAHPALVDGFTLTHGNADEGAGACLMKGTTLSKCNIVNNIAGENGAALYASGDTLKQLIVANNSGIGIAAQNTKLLHCTAVRNSGDGISLLGENIQDTNLLCNSIIWGNGLRNLHFISAIALNNTEVQHCAIAHQTVSGAESIALSSENADGAGPHFVLPADTAGVVNILGNWQLDSTSVCLNAGMQLSDFYGIRTDIAGQSRVQNGRADIGAWESPYQTQVLCRNEEVFLYEGDSYTFYDTTLTTSGWYARRWNVGEADSLVTLHLITKQVVYVSVEGAGSKDGSSWANALDGQTATANGSTKLADALQLATVGTEFWIQSGTYYACSDSDVNKSFVLNEGVSLYGGFDGTETTVAQRDAANAPTVFSGNLQNDTLMENYSRNIFKTNEQNTLAHPIVLNGISITEGYNDIHTGCALHIGSTSEIRAEHCRFHHCFGSAISNEGLFKGNYCSMDSNISFSSYWVSYHRYIFGSLYYEGAAALTNKQSGVVSIKNCQVTHNSAPYDGALFNNGIMKIDATDISYNTATDGHIGAVYNEGRLVVANSHFSHNTSYEEMSTIASWGNLTMDNCQVEYNAPQQINPFYFRPNRQMASLSRSAHIWIDGEAEVTNCCFAHNWQNAAGGGGALHLNSGKTIVKKCNFVDNIGIGTSGSDASYFYEGEFSNTQDSSGGGGISISVSLRSSVPDGVGVHVENGNMYVEDCLFDGLISGIGSSACVMYGNLTMNRCIFTQNNGDYQELLRDRECVLYSRAGTLMIYNSLFANNQTARFLRQTSWDSYTSFSNCTFANNGGFVGFHEYHNGGAGDSTHIVDTAHVNFNNCIIAGNWQAVESECLDGISPNFTLQFRNTLFDSIRTNPLAETPDSNLVPDSLGNLYYCNPMFVNPTTVAGIDSTQNPLEADFRLLPASPCINSGDTTGLHLTAASTDLAGNRRIMRCLIDRGCYEYGTIVYDTVRESLCVGPEETEASAYEGHGFSLTQLPVGESSFTRECDCHPDANDTVLTLRITVRQSVAEETEATACDSFVWNGTVYYRPGDYIQTFPAANGCDSIVTLHLTMYQSLIVQQELNLCENDLPYHYVNGDIDTTFEIGTPQLSIFNFQLLTQYGCDSTVRLTVAVHSTATDSIAAALCEEDLPYHYVNGDIDTTFDVGTPQLSTFNFQLLTQYGCDSVVTLHLTITPSDTTGIITYDDGSFAVYPNPTNSIVNVRLDGNGTTWNAAEIQVFDVFGRLLRTVETCHGASLQTTQIDLSSYAPGVYLIQLVGDGRVIGVRKVVRK